MKVGKLLAKSSSLRVVGGMVQLAFTFAIARQLPAETAGSFFFLFALVSIVSVVVRLGTEASALREVAIAFSDVRDNAVERELYSRAVIVFTVSILTGLGFYFISVSGPMLVSPLDAAVTSGALIFAALSGLGAECLKAVERPGLALLTQNVLMPTVAISVLMSVSAIDGVSLTVALIAVLAGYFTSFVVALTTLIRVVRPGRWVASRVEVQRAIVEHVVRSPLLLAGVMAPAVMQWSGSVVLGFLASPAAVAGYTVAARLASVVGLVNSAAASVIAPQLAVHASRGDTKKFSAGVHVAGFSILALSLVPIVVLFVAAPWILSLFGPDYETFALVLQILMVGQLVAATIGHGGQVLVAGGHYRLAAIGPAVALIVYLTLLFSLVPLFGAPGAAAALATAVVAGHLTAAICLRRATATWPFPVGRSDWRNITRRSD